MSERLKLLVTVKTYPHPSASYMELVCTAGVLEDGSFIRLYPVDYRYRPYWQWYSKYQWIQVEAERNERDSRPESFRPSEGAVIKPLGQPIGSQEGTWAERKKYVLAKGTKTMCRLAKMGQRERSLGIVRAVDVLNLRVRETEREWKSQWEKLFDQKRLFGPQQKPLEKIPYRFSYVFRCEEEGCKGHDMMIADWEIGELYLKMRDKHSSEEAAVKKVKDKFLGQLCSQDRDTHFFVGTVKEHGTWIVLGVFWPKKELLMGLPLE